MYVVDGLVWVHDADPYALVGYDLKDGTEKRRFSTTDALRMTHHHRCYRAKATERYVLMGRRGTEFLDLETGENTCNHWVRGTCRLGIVPGNGLLYAPPHPCVCHITSKLNGLYALAPERSGALYSQEPAVEAGTHLERGPAYGEENKPADAEPAEDNWPIYRHNAQRSGATRCAVPDEVTPSWTAQLPGKPSSCVAANSKVFVASTDTHTLYALDAVSGDKVWTYTAAGRIDTPPTVYRGLVLFGSADGWVYCLRAGDGTPVWAFRAAPDDVQVVDHGQPASAWPVHGNILVENGVAYTCAGRSSYLDGGVYLYALNPSTGEVLQQHRIYSPEPETGEMPHCELRYDMPPDQPGALSDIMVSNGHSIYMRHLRFDPENLSRHSLAGGVELISRVERGVAERKGPHDFKYTGQHPGVGPQLISNSGLLDDSYFNQSFWTVQGKGHSRLLVFDGMIAACSGGSAPSCLYISLVNGALLCMGGNG